MYILIIVYHIILSRKWRFLSLVKFLLKTFLLIFYKKKIDRCANIDISSILAL